MAVGGSWWSVVGGGWVGGQIGVRLSVASNRRDAPLTLPTFFGHSDGSPLNRSKLSRSGSDGPMGDCWWVACRFASPPDLASASAFAVFDPLPTAEIAGIVFHLRNPHDMRIRVRWRHADATGPSRNGVRLKRLEFVTKFLLNILQIAHDWRLCAASGQPTSKPAASQPTNKPANQRPATMVANLHC